MTTHQQIKYICDELQNTIMMLIVDHLLLPFSAEKIPEALELIEERAALDPVHRYKNKNTKNHKKLMH